MEDLEEILDKIDDLKLMKALAGELNEAEELDLRNLEIKKMQKWSDLKD